MWCFDLVFRCGASIWCFDVVLRSERSWDKYSSSPVCYFLIHACNYMSLLALSTMMSSFKWKWMIISLSFSLPSLIVAIPSEPPSPTPPPAILAPRQTDPSVIGWFSTGSTCKTCYPSPYLERRRNLLIFWVSRCPTQLWFGANILPIVYVRRLRLDHEFPVYFACGMPWELFRAVRWRDGILVSSPYPYLD
jgi:hypothetical protein